MLGAKAAFENGYALVSVLVFVSVALFTMGAVLQWSSQNSHLALRNSRYHTAILAADGVAERIAGGVMADFMEGDHELVFSRLSSYATMLPSKNESDYWQDYVFSDSSGVEGRTSIQLIAPRAYRELETKYEPAHGYSARYRLTIGVEEAREDRPVGAGLEQELEIAAIPIFGFGAFCFSDIEISSETSMALSGRIHSNGSITAQPEGVVRFLGHVTAAGDIEANRRAIFSRSRDTGVAALNLPLGQRNTPEVLRSMIEVPPGSEQESSPIGHHRYYNRADLIVRVQGGSVSATSGASDDFRASIGYLESAGIIGLDNDFYDRRELRRVAVIDVDISKLNKEYKKLAQDLGVAPRTIFIVDERSHDPEWQSGVRLVNGQTLPDEGLTIATASPLYVLGHFNADSRDLGTDSTSRCSPASLVADAVTILSESWKDSRSGGWISSRKASDTTVNAAVMTGVASGNGGLSNGGLENALRLLENWDDDTLTFNGSLVIGFESAIATAPWGIMWGVYTPPERHWSFDRNFLQEERLPPATPSVRTMIRSRWTPIERRSS